MSPTPTNSNRGSARSQAGSRAVLSELVVTGEAIGAIDRACADEYGLPTLVLMENAARGLAEAILEHLQTAPACDNLDQGVLVIAGSGHNGGDAIAAARHLHNAGIDVAITLVANPDRCAEATKLHLNVAERMGISITPGIKDDAFCPPAPRGCIVDAMVGVGLSRALAGVYAQAAEWMNQQRSSGASVVAVDVPSGLDADTGKAPGACVLADLTVTMTAHKPGLLTPQGREKAGGVVVVDIGAPIELLERHARRAGYR